MKQTKSHQETPEKYRDYIFFPFSQKKIEIKDKLRSAKK